MRSQRRAYLQTQAHSRTEARRRAEEGGVIVIDSDDEGEAGPSSAPPRVGDPGEGCSRDAAGEARGDDDGGEEMPEEGLILCDGQSSEVD